MASTNDLCLYKLNVSYDTIEKLGSHFDQIQVWVALLSDDYWYGSESHIIGEIRELPNSHFSRMSVSIRVENRSQEILQFGQRHIQIKLGKPENL